MVRFGASLWMSWPEGSLLDAGEGGGVRRQLTGGGGGGWAGGGGVGGSVRCLRAGAGGEGAGARLLAQRPSRQ